MRVFLTCGHIMIQIQIQIQITIQTIRMLAHGTGIEQME